MKTKPISIVVSVAVALIVSGCEPQEEADTLFAASKTHTKSVVRSEKSRDNSYGTSRDGILQNEVPDELANSLSKLELKVENVTDEFDATLKNLRANDSDLNAALDAPLKTPLLTSDSKPLGPTALEAAKQTMPLFLALLDDYKKNSKDSAETKAQLENLYNIVIAEAWSGGIPDAASLKSICEMIYDGNHDPLVLLTAFMSRIMSEKDRLKYQPILVNELQSRPCSDLTKFVAVSTCGDGLPFNELQAATLVAIESGPRVWKQYGEKVEYRPFLTDRLTRIFDLLNGNCLLYTSDAADE